MRGARKRLKCTQPIKFGKNKGKPCGSVVRVDAMGNLSCERARHADVEVVERFLEREGSTFEDKEKAAGEAG